MRDIGYLFGAFIETFELLFDFVVWKKKYLSYSVQLISFY